MPVKNARKPAGKTTTRKPATSSTVVQVPESSAVIEEREPMGASTPVLEKSVAVEKPGYEDDDYVAVIRRNWGDARLCPPDLVDYMDGFTFTGGVARNIPYEQVKKWVKRGLISASHVFPNNAQPVAFVKATGRNPQSPEHLAAAIHTLTPDKIAAILGDEAALKLAQDVKRLISSRNKEEF